MMNSPCQNCFQNINPKFIEPNGFVGNSNYDFKRFCEELYLTLYKDREGFEDTALLLRELYLRTNIDGAEVARRNGFGSFELLLKDKMFSHVVGFEKIGDQYSYRYYARLSKEFEHIRRTVIPKERALQYLGRMSRYNQKAHGF